MTRVHFLRMQGGPPVQFTIERDSQSAGCHACRSMEDASGNLFHSHDCEAARVAVARDVQDITTDGAAAFVGAMRAQLAEEHADRILGDRSSDDAGDKVDQRRIDLVGGYLAGYAKAEDSAVEIVQIGLSRLSSEIAAWSGRSR